MKNILIEFSTSGSIVSRTIRWFTWGKWSHVSVRMPEGDLIEAKEFLGVVRRKWTYELGEVLTLQVSDEQAERFYSALRSQVGKSYDWRAIVGFLVRRDWQRDNYWICSELAAWALIKAGVPVIHEKRWRVNPTILYMALLAHGAQRVLTS